MDNIFDDIPFEPKPLAKPTAPARNNKIRHQSLTSSQLKAGKAKLADLTEESFETLHEAMRHAEYPTAIAAAKIILDRAGFGPSSTVHLDTKDLEEVPTETLAARAIELLGASQDGKNLLERVMSLRKTDKEETTDRVH